MVVIRWVIRTTVLGVKSNLQNKRWWGCQISAQTVFLQQVTTGARRSEASKGDNDLQYIHCCICLLIMQVFLFMVHHQQMISWCSEFWCLFVHGAWFIFICCLLTVTAFKEEEEIWLGLGTKMQNTRGFIMSTSTWNSVKKWWVIKFQEAERSIRERGVDFRIDSIRTMMATNVSKPKCKIRSLRSRRDPTGPGTKDHVAYMHCIFALQWDDKQQLVALLERQHLQKHAKGDQNSQFHKVTRE